MKRQGPRNPSAITGSRRTPACAVVLACLAGCAAPLHAADPVRAIYESRVAMYESSKMNADLASRFRLGADVVLRAHDAGETDDCRRVGREVLVVWRAAETRGEDWTTSFTMRSLLLDVYGRIERALMNGGRVGEGWEKLVEGMDVWRGFTGIAAARGTPVSPEEAARVTTPYRGFGWRWVERQAYYLHLCGRSNEALDWLKRASILTERDLAPEADAFARFYAAKLLAQQAEICDFIGQEQNALEFYERLIAVHRDATGDVRQQRIHQVDRLRLLSELHGVGDALIGEARGILEEAERAGSEQADDVRKVIAVLESERDVTRGKLERLRVKEAPAEGPAPDLAALLAARHAVLAAPGDGDEEAEEKLLAPLKQAFAKGALNAEPILARRYGSFLLDHDRAAEAAPVLRQALLRAGEFQWLALEPELQALLATARVKSGDVAAAKDNLAWMDAMLSGERPIPPFRIVQARRLQIEALLGLGEKEKAREVLEKARAFAAEHQVNTLDAESLAEDLMAPLFAAPLPPPLSPVAAVPPFPQPATPFLLNASLATENSYLPILVQPEVPFSGDEEVRSPTAFRVVARIPLRVEYRDAGTHGLLALDANGNGDFTDAGDFYPPDAATRGFPRAAIVRPPEGPSFLPVELRITGGVSGDRIAPPEGITLRAEIWNGEEWIPAIQNHGEADGK